MADTSFLPALSPSDIEQAAKLIQQANAPSAGTDVVQLQQQLFEIQKRPESWGLIIPFLDSNDQTIQFFGAHTAQVKIARDWESFPQEHAERLRDLMIQLCAHYASIHGLPKFILRKLFVALSSLALRLVPLRPTKWDGWLMGCVTAFASQGVPPENIHDFLAIASEEINSADLLGPAKGQMKQTLLDSTQMVISGVRTSIDPNSSSINPPSPQEFEAALRCFQAWLTTIRSDNLIPIIPVLISNLSSPDSSRFVVSSTTLQEILQHSALSDGSGTKSLTEPLLSWLDGAGSVLIQRGTSADGSVDSETLHSICKLLCAIGDHSTSWLAANLSSQAHIAPNAQGPTKSHLTQTFLRSLLLFTGLEGWYPVDEEESEMTLGFWYLFQEALWTIDDFYFPEDEDPGYTKDASGDGCLDLAKAVYIELVKILKRKVCFPPADYRWTKDQVQMFEGYRRDVGDTLINAYYILREDMLGYFVEDVSTRLVNHQQGKNWEEVEASLYCIMSIQEAMDYETTPSSVKAEQAMSKTNTFLGRLFGPEVLGKLPNSGEGLERLRRTVVSIIGTYSSWFASQPAGSPTMADSLMAVVSYVVSALTEPSICLQAANALKNLCDANRKALSDKISAFGELHAGLDRIPDPEKPKILQSIASVIQALPPEEEIAPIETIVDPITQRLIQALQSSSQHSEESRSTAIIQLEALTGVTKGLTRVQETVLALDDHEDPETKAELERVNRAREDMRAVRMREQIFVAIRGCTELWSLDAGVSTAISDLIKAITSLPADTTILTLPASPIMELICTAIQRQVTSAWLSLASMIIGQLNPPTFSMTTKTGPSPDAVNVLHRTLPMLLSSTLGFLAMNGNLEANPDIVQDFFSCMDRVAQDLTSAFYELPSGAVDALMQCSIQCLSHQERYSLTATTRFLGTLIHRSSVHEDLVPKRDALLQAHGYSITKAILQGFAGATPVTATLNLVELMQALVTRVLQDSRKWVPAVLFAPDFYPSKATDEDKQRLSKALANGKSMRKLRDACQQFSMIARGLSGTNFGISTLTM